MTAAKMETAAERYRRKRIERQRSELVDVTCPSGDIFKCRAVTVPFLVTSGILPLHLVELMTQAAADGSVTPEKAFESLPVREKIQSIEFAAKLVKYVCVEPRIVETPTEPNDLAQDELDLDDFNYIVTWAMTGGAEAAGLDTFRT
jgi:hypothetical protein